jgi:hypothetical protein
LICLVAYKFEYELLHSSGPQLVVGF